MLLKAALYIMAGTADHASFRKPTLVLCAAYSMLSLLPATLRHAAGRLKQLFSWPAC